jgi:hypothetical protein
MEDWKGIRGLRERLVTLWSDSQKTRSDIARILSYEFKVLVTYNAVVGESNRLKLKSKPDAVGKHPSGHRVHRVDKPRTPKVAKERTTLSEPSQKQKPSLSPIVPDGWGCHRKVWGGDRHH